jgi:hypothetical protein
MRWAGQPGHVSRRPAGFEVIPLGLTLQAAWAHPARLPAIRSVIVSASGENHTVAQAARTAATARGRPTAE